MKCSKCNDPFEGGCTYIEGGNAYQFCKTCTDILETFPVPTNIMHMFLNPNQKDKAIFSARKERLNGKSPW